MTPEKSYPEGPGIPADNGTSRGRPWKTAALLLVFATTTLFAFSCASGNGAQEVVLDGLNFHPRALEVEAGTTVRWVSEDAVLHTVTSGEQGTQGVPGVSEGEPAQASGLFDQDMPDEGSTFAFTFDEPGTYPYFCEIHPGMAGEIVVR